MCILVAKLNTWFGSRQQINVSLSNTCTKPVAICWEKNVSLNYHAAAYINAKPHSRRDANLFFLLETRTAAMTTRQYKNADTKRSRF